MSPVSSSGSSSINKGRRMERWPEFWTCGLLARKANGMFFPGRSGFPIYVSLKALKHAPKREVAGPHHSVTSPTGQFGFDSDGIAPLRKASESPHLRPGQVGGV